MRRVPMYELYIANKNYSSWSLRPWVLMRNCGSSSPNTCCASDRRRAGRTSGGFRRPAKCPCLVDGDDRRVGLARDRRVSGRTACRHLAARIPVARAWARSAAAEMHSGFGELRNRCSMSCGVRVRLNEIPVSARAGCRPGRRAVERWIASLRRSMSRRKDIHGRRCLFCAGRLPDTDLCARARCRCRRLRGTPAEARIDARMVCSGARRNVPRRAARGRDTSGGKRDGRLPQHLSGGIDLPARYSRGLRNRSYSRASGEPGSGCQS